MTCTPESNVYLESHKHQDSHDCSDSGYSGFFQSPRSVSGVRCGPSSPAEFSETPKENLKLPDTPKERAGKPEERSERGSRETLRPSAVSWCETPRSYKRDGSLRHRLLMCKEKNESARSPTSGRTGVRPERWLSSAFDSLEITSGGSWSTSALEQDLPLSGRKRRLLFTQARTSTLKDGKIVTSQLPTFDRSSSLIEEDLSGSPSADTPSFFKAQPASRKEHFQSPANKEPNILSESSGVLTTPSFSQTPKYSRSACEDSGFGSLTLDKSQDSLVDHDGSFQELLLSASRRNRETPNLADGRQRSRLPRQHRLSTLKEGGSQSEEELLDRKHQPCFRCLRHCHEDEVFAEDVTPSTSCKCFNTQSSAQHDHALKADATRSESTTPSNSSTTSLGATPQNLSLTPALQLVHSMCQQKLQMSAGQSPSLKEELKFTAALVRTPLTFRTTMPLAGLIGRKMGLAKVDILTELKRRNLGHILTLILAKLDSESVYRLGQVCKSWNQIVQQDKPASLKRRNYRIDLEASVELGTVHICDAETRTALLKRSALKILQAQSRTSSFCTPQLASTTLTPLEHSGPRSGSSSSKQEKYMEIAKTLFHDESLRPCPRCQHPARCHAVKREGVCSRADCSFKFCTSCLCMFHGSRECGSQSMGRRKKDSIVPGSAQSKRNVKRL
ncbi:F-box only protein 43 [Oryzias melastigma]|uniref:F-box only protein 43 n=1 Tax=Oryzias melastigma TaxID=30732 RepID=UPI00168CC90A|nr:F-box only protein 43 [Oryzias melastigma]